MSSYDEGSLNGDDDFDDEDAASDDRGEVNDERLRKIRIDEFAAKALSRTNPEAALVGMISADFMTLLFRYHSDVMKLLNSGANVTSDRSLQRAVPMLLGLARQIERNSQTARALEAVLEKGKPFGPARRAAKNSWMDS